jgi:uncharacterized C2H2 Zn-finger protein
MVILSWCDVCDDEDVRTEGDTYTLAIGNGQLLDIEVCDKHAVPVLKVIELLKNYGKKGDTPTLPTPPKRAGTVASVRGARGPYGPRGVGQPFPSKEDDGNNKNVQHCIACNLAFSSRGPYDSHMNKEHGLTGSFAEVYGKRCPECGRDDFSSMRNMSIHLSTVHGVRGHVTRALALSEDKFGVVAEARKRVTNAGAQLL